LAKAVIRKQHPGNQNLALEMPHLNDRV